MIKGVDDQLSDGHGDTWSLAFERGGTSGADPTANAWLTCGSTARKSDDDRKKDEKSKYTYASSAREQRKGSLAKFRWHRSVKKQKRKAIVRSFAKEFVMCERKTMHNWTPAEIDALAAFMHQRWKKRGGHSFRRIPTKKR